MKKAFTLIELLIVVVILVILMTFLFRLGNIGNDATRRAITIDRIQRMENALSGYYAAYGMYPPVRLHGERNIYLKVDGKGYQSNTGEQNTSIWGWLNSSGNGVNNSSRESLSWRQVETACRSQPISCEYPFDRKYKALIDAASVELQMWATQSEYMPDWYRAVAAPGYDDGVTENIGRHRKNKDFKDWKNIQLFKFGLLSYLLPRYLVMMNGDESFFTDYAQWTGNNREPSDPINGRQMDWTDVRRYANSTDNNQLMHIANVPSQAACARWMANFECSLTANFSMTLYGIQIRDSSDWTFGTIPFWEEGEDAAHSYYGGTIYNPDGYNSTSDGNYALDCITMRDGWRRELFYYSPEPYQSYVFWSSGANGRTFPPWISKDKLSADANRCVSYWTRDDIVGLKN